MSYRYTTLSAEHRYIWPPFNTYRTFAHGRRCRNSHLERTDAAWQPVRLRNDRDQRRVARRYITQGKSLCTGTPSGRLPHAVSPHSRCYSTDIASFTVFIWSPQSGAEEC